MLFPLRPPAKIISLGYNTKTEYRNARFKSYHFQLRKKRYYILVLTLFNLSSPTAHLWVPRLMFEKFDRKICDILGRKNKVNTPAFPAAASCQKNPRVFRNGSPLSARQKGSFLNLLNLFCYMRTVSPSRKSNSRR